MKLTLILAIALSAGAQAFAQTPTPSPSPSLKPDASPGNQQRPQDPQHHAGFVFKQLNLSSEQQQQVRQVMESNKETAKSTLLAILVAEKALHDTIAANPSDETSIRALALNVANAKTTFTVQNAKVHGQIIALMTPEQKAKLADFDKKRDEWLQQRINRLSSTETPSEPSFGDEE